MPMWDCPRHSVVAGLGNKQPVAILQTPACLLCYVQAMYRFACWARGWSARLAPAARTAAHLTAAIGTQRRSPCRIWAI